MDYNALKYYKLISKNHSIIIINYKFSYTKNNNNYIQYILQRLIKYYN